MSVQEAVKSLSSLLVQLNSEADNVGPIAQIEELVTETVCLHMPWVSSCHGVVRLVAAVHTAYLLAPYFTNSGGCMSTGFDGPGGLHAESQETGARAHLSLQGSAVVQTERYRHAAFGNPDAAQQLVVAQLDDSVSIPSPQEHWHGVVVRTLVRCVCPPPSVGLCALFRARPVDPLRRKQAASCRSR